MCVCVCSYIYEYIHDIVHPLIYFPNHCFINSSEKSFIASQVHYKADSRLWNEVMEQVTYFHVQIYHLSVDDLRHFT